MKVEKLAAWAEIVSSVAIVATLIYLAVQTSQTNKALEANTRQATLMADISLIGTMIDNGETFAKYPYPSSALSDTETRQLGNMLAGLLRTREFAWLQYKAGTLDEATFLSYMETPVRILIDSESMTETWENIFRAGANPEFAEILDTMIEQGKQQRSIP
jgi:hypothetical protein